MTDYTKLTGPKLREILTSRQLPTNGLKTELIARLAAADSSTTATPEAPPAAATPTAEPTNSHLPTEEYTVDWSDDTGATTTKPSTTAAPAQSSKPARKSIAALFDDPPKADAPAPATTKTGNEPSSPSTVTSESAPTTSTAAPAPVFAANLPTTSLDDEIARRKKRAERFGLSAQESDALKALERQKRFGVEKVAATVGGLDDALPEQQRKRREQQQGGRGGGKRGRFTGGRFTEGRKRGNEDGNRNEVQTGRVQKSVTAVDPAEKRKAEERRKRFAT
jgi:SAP domain-containing ribonucleoprotein